MAENVLLKNAEGESVVYKGVSGVELFSENDATATFIHDAEIRYENLPDKPEFAPVATEGTYASLKEKPFYDIPAVLEETELAFELDEEFQIYVAGFNGAVEMIPGEEYKVIWDGREYVCVCLGGQIFEGIGDESTRFLGNKTLFWNAGFGEDTGEPFCIWNMAEDVLNFAVETLETKATHTVSIAPVNETKKIDKKYLPDNIGGGISAADVAAMFASAGIVEPAAVEDNFILSDDENDIYVY